MNSHQIIESAFRQKYCPATTQYAKFPLRPLSVSTLNAVAATSGLADVALPLSASFGIHTNSATTAKRKQSSSKSLKKRYGFVDIAHSVIGPVPQLEYVIPGLVKGNTAGIVAPGGTSKGHFCIGLAIASSLGIEVCGGALPASAAIRRTLIIQAEDDIASLEIRVRAWIEHLYQKPDIRKRFRTIKQLAEGIQEQFQMRAIPSVAAILMNQDGEPTDMLRKIVDAADRYDLIFLDPLRRFFGGNENDSGSMTQFIGQLEAISGTTGVSFILPQHANKASTTTGSGLSANAVRGSSALTDALRMQINMYSMTAAEAKFHKLEATEAHKYVRLGMTKCNHGPILPPAWLKRLDGGVLEKIELGQKMDSYSDAEPRKAKNSSAGAKFVEELFDDE